MAHVEMRDRSATLPPGLRALKPSVVLPLDPGCRRITDHVEPVRLWFVWSLRGKRAFDLLAGAGLLAALSPLFLLLIVWIPLDSKGGAFFRNKRIGLHGRTFHVYKFRTMRHDAHMRREQMIRSDNPERLLFKDKHDPRVTRLGYFLRKYSLDELPQILNVLRGEMSLIGARPLLKEDFEHVGISDPLYKEWVRDRHLLWPGITGLWQVSGRSELSLNRSMECDLHYVRQWSLWLDFKILVLTLPAILKGKGAY